MITLTELEIRKRWQAAFEAKQAENDRMKNAFMWLYAFEKHLVEGESWDSSYRTPEQFGYVNRRYNSFMEALPEAKYKGKGAIAMQAAADKYINQSNLKREKMHTMLEVAALGTGAIFIQPVEYVKYIRGDKKGKLMYKGLSAESVSWRNLFPSPGVKNIHDHTGQNFCPYIFRTKIYTYDTFKRIAEGGGWKNIDKVKPGAWGQYNIWGDNQFTTIHESQEAGSEGDAFVTVLEYWDQELDMFEIYGSGGVHLYSSKDGIPYSHKMIPFHVYRNSARLDSVNGVGEVNKALPYNLFRERALNLGMKGSELALQPAMVIDGDVQFNTEENELDIGAVFSTRGLAGGKLQDHIMPLAIPDGFSLNVQNLLKVLEDSRMSVMSDDPVSMYSNPNQLATQINAKTKNLNKDIDGNAKMNLYDTEKYLMIQIASFIKNEFSSSYKDNGKVVRASVKVMGYNVVQSDKNSTAKFKREEGAEGEFFLNENMSKELEEADLEMISAIKDDELKRDRTEKLMVLTNNIMQTQAALAQTNPEMIQSMFGGMNIAALLKAQAKELGVSAELADIFPTIKKEGYEIDAISAEHEQILAGITPPIRSDENSVEELPVHMEFINSSFFKKNATPAAKKAANAHLILTMKNVQTQNETPIEERQQEVERRKRELSKTKLAIPQGMDGTQVGGEQGNSPKQQAQRPVG